MMPVATMQMNAFRVDHDKALPSLPSPTLSNPDMMLPSIDRHLSATSHSHAAPPSPSYLRERSNGDATAHHVITTSTKEKRGLMSRKMMLLRSQTNSNSSIPTSQSQPEVSSRGAQGQHQRNHPSISTLNDEPTLASSPTLADGKALLTRNRSSGGSLNSEDMDGMPAFLAKYQNKPGMGSEDGLSRISREGDEDDDDNDTQMETATVIEDSVEAQRQQQEKDEQASAILSKRAEQILANAKRRLNVMEGNLRGARDLVAPLTAANLKRATSLGSSHGAPSFSRSLLASGSYERGVQPGRMLHSQVSSPTMSRDYQGHARNFSANSVHDRFRNPGRQSIARSNRIPVKISSPVVDHRLRSSRSVDSFANNSAIYHALSGDSNQPYRTSPDPALEPLQEDDASQMGTYDSHGFQTHASSLPRYSPSIPDDLRSQMSSLKGKISTLKERAREDSLRRQSQQNLKTPSPFSNATVDTPEFYYNPSQGQEGVTVDGNPAATKTDRTTLHSPALSLTGRDSPGTPRSGNAFAERAAAEIQTLTGSPYHTQTPDLARTLRSTASAYQLSPHKRTPSGSAIIQSAKQRFSHHQHQISKDSSNSNSSKGSVLNPNGRRFSTNGHFTYRDDGNFESTGVQMDNVDAMSDDNESIYEDAEDNSEPAVVAHEDRDDAFDYEQFFLHSAMMSYSKTRRGSTSSDDSVSSAQTARGPGTAIRSKGDDAMLNDDLDGFLPSCPQTPERLREIEWDLHNRSHSSNSVNTVSTFETAHEARSRPGTAASHYHPAPEWEPSTHKRSSSRPGTAIRRTIPSDSSSDRADSGIGGLPPRSQSAAAIERKTAPMALQSSFMAGLGFAASAISPPISPIDPATVAVNALSRPGGKQLGLKDKALLFGLVDALRTTCWQMQAAEDGQYYDSRLRRRLEMAKRVLEGLDDEPDDLAVQPVSN